MTSNRDGSVRVWDITEVVRPGRAVPWAAGARTVEFSPDGRLLATDGVDGAARVYDTATGRPALPPLVHGGWVRFATFSPDRRLLATGGDDSVVQLWEVATGAAVAGPLSQPGWALNARFSPDGRRLLVGTTAGVARLWDLDTFQPIGPVLTHPVPAGHEIWNVAFSPDGQVALTGTTLTAGAEGTVGFWDASTGKPLAPFARFHQSIAQLVVGCNPSELYVVEGGRVHCFDLSSFQECRPPVGQRVESIALLPSGKTLLAAGSDKTARLWNIASGQPTGPILEHDEPVRAVAVAPDGATLLTLAGDRLRFWDAVTGQTLGPAREHTGLSNMSPVHDRMPVVFRPDGRGAASAGGAVFLWDVPVLPPTGGLDAARLADSVLAQISTAEKGRDELLMLDKEHWKRLVQVAVDQADSDPPGGADWHDTLAAEGERSGEVYTTRWHLDRLLAARPNDWAGFARAPRRAGARRCRRRSRRLGARSRARWRECGAGVGGA